VVFLNPDTAWIALIVGLLGVYFELCSPRWVLPGVAGGVLVMLSVASLTRMHPHLDGAVLVVIGIGLLGMRGTWSIAGTAALVWGAARLVEGIHVVTAVASCVPFAAITVFLLSTAIEARRNKRTPTAALPR
jgi:membrane-bound serine protease (ClpP class)